MRVLGLDVGTKRIGVALSDELGLTAQALATHRRTGLTKDFAWLKALAQEQSVERIVVGLPIGMSGEEGPAAAAAREFGRRLEEQLKVPVAFWDERLSTVAAERVLLDAGMSRKKRRQVVDRVAASIILQGWLDSRADGNLLQESD